VGGFFGAFEAEGDAAKVVHVHPECLLTGFYFIGVEK
jgi:hypothetical protein